MTPPTQGSGWGESLIYQFLNNGDGATPYGGLTADSHGNLYTTTTGVYANNAGTVIKLSRPLRGGVLTEKTLHQFAGHRDAGRPFSGVIVVNDAVFGTTTLGGTGNCSPHGCGTVYEIEP